MRLSQGLSDIAQLRFQKLNPWVAIFSKLNHGYQESCFERHIEMYIQDGMNFSWELSFQVKIIFSFLT